ncbi:MAG: tRNA lysidine(34) synthetase TilS [Thermomicrobiales bacterium]
MSDSGLLQRVRRRLLHTFSSGEMPVVVAGWSGGADSTALVVLLRNLERLGLLHLHAVHVDHGVRPESGREGALLAEVATSLGVRFRSVTLDREAVARHRGVGLEEAMRRERYRVLVVAANAVGGSVIATGHHRGDQAETVLLHLMRGSGLRGASGMREDLSIAVPWWDEVANAVTVRLWRPLLPESPDDLRAMVEAQGLPILADPSNTSDEFRRNAIRHRVLPMLDEIVPGAGANLAAFAERSADDDDALDAFAREALGDPEGPLLRSRVLGHPLAIQRRMVRRWVANAAPHLDLTFDRTEAIRGLVERNEGGKVVEIGAGWQVRLRHGALETVAPGNER